MRIGTVLRQTDTLRVDMEGGGWRKDEQRESKIRALLSWGSIYHPFLYLLTPTAANPTLQPNTSGRPYVLMLVPKHWLKVTAVYLLPMTNVAPRRHTFVLRVETPLSSNSFTCVTHDAVSV